MSPPRRRRPRRPGDDALKRIAFAWLAVAAVVASLAGCGGGGGQTPTVTVPVRVIPVVDYFVRGGRVQPVFRSVSVTASGTTAVARAALVNLSAGPTSDEVRELALSSEVSGAFDDLTISDGVAHVQRNEGRVALAQIVYTLTGFPTVKAVEVEGKRYTRKDFEDETPIILVESPLPFQTVKSPLHATGTANTFEATFQYDLVAPDGTVVKTHFVTATSGTGTRGTFDFSVPFTVDRGGLGTLVVYELSAADGSRIHETRIPLRLAR